MKTDNQNINDNLFDEIAKSGLDEFKVNEQDIKSINNKISNRAGGNKFKIYFSLIVSVLFFGLLAWYFTNSKHEKELTAEKNIVIKNKRVADSIVKDNQIQNTFIVAEEINEVVKTVESTRVEVRFKPLPMVKKEIQLIEPVNKETENLVSFNVFVKRVNQFLVVDYIKAGRYVNKADKTYLYQFKNPETSDSQTDKIDIELQLIKAIGYLEINDYSSCIKNLKVIEEFFKDDLNVLFYKAYCNFKLGNYDYAIGGFNGCVNHKYNVFKEEAQYYTALCYFGQGNIEEGKERLRDIINSNGIYKNKAESYLIAFNVK